MKTITFILLSFAIFGAALADTSDLIYLRIEPIIGDTPPLADAGIISGCYIGPGKECNGLFYMNDDGSGIFVGTIINDLVPNPEFELLYSIKLTVEGGRDMLVGSAYAIQLSPEGEILSGRRTEIRQYLAYGEENVIAQPVGRLSNGKTIFLQMLAERKRPKEDDKLAEHPVTLISTQLMNGEQSSQARNWYNSLGSVHSFRAGFKSKEENGSYELLRYDVEIDLSSTAERGREPLRGQLSFSRTYSIDTLYHPHSSFAADVVYSSKYSRDIDLVPGKMLKLIFPPDTPSVRGFNIEDTLIIVP
jgi:hypothetical protein